MRLNNMAVSANKSSAAEALWAHLRTCFKRRFIRESIHARRWSPSLRAVSGIQTVGELMTRLISSDDLSVRKKIAAVVIIGLLLIAACAPGLAVLLDPIRSTTPPWYTVTLLDRIPLNGEPKWFPVMVSRSDAWENHPAQPVGSVYLRRLPDTGEVVALSSLSPWLGCQVEYDDEQVCFRYPCHCEEYDLDGRRVGANPAPRDLDALDVVVHDNKVLVNWQEFRLGTTEKIAIE